MWKSIYPHHVFHHYPSLGFCDSRNTNFSAQNTVTPRSIHHIQVFSIDLKPQKPEQQMGTTEVGFAKTVCRIAFENVKHIHVCKHRQTHRNQSMNLDVSIQQIFWTIKARILLVGHHYYHALALVFTNTAHNPAPSPNSNEDLQKKQHLQSTVEIQSFNLHHQKSNHNIMTKRHHMCLLVNQQGEPHNHFLSNENSFHTPRF